MKRIVNLCAAIGFTAMFAPAPVMAQEPGVIAQEQCWRAVAHAARGRFSARDVDQLSSNWNPISPVENGVEGRGTADGRPFAFSCTYNWRTRRTYSVAVRGEVRRLPLPGGSWIESCTNPEMRGPVLLARCRHIGGGWSGTRIDIRNCPSGRAANRDGVLVCG